MDYLIHHGVKGQKWGVRNNKNNPRYSVKRNYGYYIDKKQYKRMKENKLRIHKKSGLWAKIYKESASDFNGYSTISDNDRRRILIAEQALNKEFNKIYSPENDYGNKIVPGTNSTYHEFVNDILSYQNLYDKIVR